MEQTTHTPGRDKGRHSKLNNYYVEVTDTQGNIVYDPDSSPLTWKHYRRVYTAEHWVLFNDFDMENVKTRGRRYKRLLAPIKRELQYFDNEEIGPLFSLGGDTDFNFNKSKCNAFKKIIKKNEEALILLEECNKHHHSLVNFSLMARSGNLQGVKGMGLDRLDVFVARLYEYFQSPSEPNVILSKATAPNKPCLKYFLSEIKDVYDYCAIFYFIQDRTFVDRILNEGQRPIESAEDAVRYMLLAKEFWKRKAEYWQSKGLALKI